MPKVFDLRPRFGEGFFVGFAVKMGWGFDRRLSKMVIFARGGDFFIIYWFGVWNFL